MFDSVVDPATDNVPATAVFPDVAATVNLSLLTSKSPSIPVFQATASVLDSVVAPVTPVCLIMWCHQ